jgi:hypothetical protein
MGVMGATAMVVMGATAMVVMERKPRQSRVGVRRQFVAIALSASLPALPGCGESATAGAGGPDGGVDAAIGAPCASLACRVNMFCPDGGTTSLSGTIYDPAGNNPLSGALAYVPLDPAAPLPSLATPGAGTCSASCEPTAGLSGHLTAFASTDTHGAFTMKYVPTGKNVPVVFQIGKWRREITVDTQDCADTAVPASLTRLPRNRQEGDIPQMAIVTGACDELGCLMKDIGLDATEFTGPAGAGALHVYRGAGPGPDLAGGGAGPAGDCTAAGCPLWTTRAGLEKYDLVLLGCECGEHNETKPDMGPMHDWLGEGGRLLATHYADTWFKNGPPDLQGVATWLASETQGPTAGPFDAVTGTGFSTWIRDVGGLNPDGSLALRAEDVSTSVSDVATDAQVSILDESMVPKVFAFPTPVEVVDGGSSVPRGPYCGRALFTDVHAGGGGQSSTAPVPASCTGGAMSAEEKALEYFVFDLFGPCYVGPAPPKGHPPNL